MIGAGSTPGLSKWDFCALCQPPLPSGPGSLLPALQLPPPLAPGPGENNMASCCQGSWGLDLMLRRKSSKPSLCTVPSEDCFLWHLSLFMKSQHGVGSFLTDKTRKSQGWKTMHNPATAAKDTVLHFAFRCCRRNRCVTFSCFSHPQSREASSQR